MVDNIESNVPEDKDSNHSTDNNIGGVAHNNTANLKEALRDLLRNPEMVNIITDIIKSKDDNSNNKDPNTLSARREYEERRQREEAENTKRNKVYDWFNVIRQTETLPYSSEIKKEIVKSEIKKLDNNVEKSGMTIDKAQALAKLVIIKEELDLSEDIVRYHKDAKRIKELYLESNVDTRDIRNEDLLEEVFNLVTISMRANESKRASEQRRDLASYRGDNGIVGLRDIYNKEQATIPDYLFYLTHGSKGINKKNPDVTIEDFKKFVGEQYKRYEKTKEARRLMTVERY
jgi:hypothetical protein